MMGRLMGSSVSIKKPLKQDLEFVNRVRNQYALLVRLITNETALRQQFLATEVYRYFKAGGIYDLVRRDLLLFLRQLDLGDRIKMTLALPQEDYEALLRKQFIGLFNAERNVPLKTIQLYMNTRPERADQFKSVLTARDRALFSELGL